MDASTCQEFSVRSPFFENGSVSRVSDLLVENKLTIGPYLSGGVGQNARSNRRHGKGVIRVGNLERNANETPGVRINGVKERSDVPGAGLGPALQSSRNDNPNSTAKRASQKASARFLQLRDGVPAKRSQSLSVCCARVGSSSGQSQPPDARKE